MKRRTYRNIEARYGFKIDEIQLDSCRGSMKKFVLKATYPDGRKLWVNVWKRTDVHKAIADTLEQERRFSGYRADYRSWAHANGESAHDYCEQAGLWDAWAAQEVPQ